MWGGLAARSWAGFCQDGCQPCGSASGHRHRGRAHGKDVLFFFFALDNFYLPAPEGLLMTPTKPHTWGPCVPVNEGTIKGSVVELGCGGKWGAGVAQKAKSKDSCLAAAAEPQCCNYGSPRAREPVPGNQGGRRWEKPRTTTRKWPPPFAATKTQCNQK